MHFFDKTKNFMGGHGIVGGHVALATGIGWSDFAIAKTDDVCICFFGEGAANIGAFHEGLNLASLWKPADRLHLREQPLQHGYSRVSRAVGAGREHTRGCLRYGPGTTSRGDDVLKVYNHVNEFVKRTRAPRRRAGAAGNQHLSFSRAFDVGSA